MITSYAPAEFQALEHRTWSAGVGKEGNPYPAGERWSLHVLCEGSPGTDALPVEPAAMAQLQGFKRHEEIVLTLEHRRFGVWIVGARAAAATAPAKVA